MRSDYYKEGLAINRRLEESQLASDLGLSAELSVDKSTGILTLQITGDVAFADLELSFDHPVNQHQDFVASLTPQQDGLYTFLAPQGVLDQRWYLLLEPVRASHVETGAQNKHWRLVGEFLPHSAENIALNAD